VSSVADSAPGRPRGRSVTIAIPDVAAAPAIAVGVALTLFLSAMVATGGLRLERTTDVLIGYMLAAAGLCAAALVRRPGRPLYGGLTLLAFALLAAITAVSITWSLSPSDSFLESGRTLAYVGVFASGIALARLAPAAWAGLLAGIGAGCVLISVYALLTKVFPASLAPAETFARLREPFEYWNSVGLMAAMGMPPMLWLAARRSGHAAVNALAWPALGVLLICVMLSYSRGTLIALAVGLGAWFAIVPLRLRALVPLAAAVVGTALVVLWTFAQDGLTTDNAPMAARVDAGHEFGAIVLLVCALLAGIGLAAQFAVTQRPPSERARWIAGRAALSLLVLVPALGLLALGNAQGGIAGQVSKSWHEVTDVNARTPANTPNRLTATSSVRARYWDEALKIYARSKWVGTGAGSYAIARTRFRKDALAVRQAHGYVVQTLADLGWAGMIASLLAAIAWLIAAARAIGLRRRDRGLPWDPERVGMVALAIVALMFGVHSAIDWTWFVPANAAAALLCAGWVAGRGPLGARLAGGRSETVARATAPAWPPPSRWARLRATERGPALAALLVVALALIAAWAAYQPVRAAHAGEIAYDRLDEGQPEAAVDVARLAVSRDPLSVDPLFELAAIEQARGDVAQSRIALEKAVHLQPANAETWRRLGRLRLSTLHDPKGALEAFQAAYYLDPVSSQSVSDVLEASRAVATPMPTP
jgi:tetratricopeptide (TPR) repeat protein